MIFVDGSVKTDRFSNTFHSDMNTYMHLCILEFCWYNLSQIFMLVFEQYNDRLTYACTRRVFTNIVSNCRHWHISSYIVIVIFGVCVKPFFFFLVLMRQTFLQAKFHIHNKEIFLNIFGCCDYFDLSLNLDIQWTVNQQICRSRRCSEWFAKDLQLRLWPKSTANHFKYADRFRLSCAKNL